MIEGISMSLRLDINWSGGGVMIYVREDILTLSKQLAKHKLSYDTEGIFIEINLRKTKWLIFGTYRPPSQSVEYLLSI